MAGNVGVASDSHSNMYGGIGCLEPPSCGRMPPPFGPPVAPGGRSLPWPRSHSTESYAAGVTGKDVIIALCGFFKSDEVLTMLWNSPVTEFDISMSIID